MSNSITYWITCESPSAAAYFLTGQAYFHTGPAYFHTGPAYFHTGPAYFHKSPAYFLTCCSALGSPFMKSELTSQRYEASSWKVNWPPSDTRPVHEKWTVLPALSSQLEKVNGLLNAFSSPFTFYRVCSTCTVKAPELYTWSNHRCPCSHLEV